MAELVASPVEHKQNDWYDTARYYDFNSEVSYLQEQNPLNTVIQG